MPHIRVTFLPERRIVDLDGPTSLADAAAQADLLLDHPCGSRGTCGKCRVRFHDGVPAPNDSDRRLLSADALSEGWRLACFTTVTQSATVEIPQVSRIASPKSFGPPDLFEGGFEPFTRSIDMRLPESKLDAQVALEDSIAGQLGFRPSITLNRLRDLIQLNAASGRNLRLILDDHELIGYADARIALRPVLGLAIDLDRPRSPVASSISLLARCSARHHS